MKFEQVFLDFSTNQISGPAGSQSVEPIVMEVLSILLQNVGEVVTRDNLIDQVWGVAFGGDQRLSRAISLLRKSLEDAGLDPNYIQTIPKRGYMLFLENEQGDQIATTKPLAKRLTKGSQATGKKKIRTGLFVTIFVAIFALIAIAFFSKFRLTSITPELPLLIVMDSAHPARVYDENVRSKGGTNADILNDILADLPIRIQKELISPSWHRHEAISQFEPELIVVHYSGFKQEDSSGDRPQLRLLIEYFLKSETEFLVYSRASNSWLDRNMNAVFEAVYAENPELKERIEIFPLLEYGEPYWKDQESAQGVKLKIKDMLQLE